MNLYPTTSSASFPIPLLLTFLSELQLNEAVMAEVMRRLKADMKRVLWMDSLPMGTAIQPKHPNGTELQVSLHILIQHYKHLLNLPLEFLVSFGHTSYVTCLSNRKIHVAKREDGVKNASGSGSSWIQRHQRLFFCPMQSFHLLMYTRNHTKWDGEGSLSTRQPRWFPQILGNGLHSNYTSFP